MYAEEVGKQIASLNAKALNPIPKSFKDMVLKHKFHIYNVGPYTWIQRMGSMGTWTIQPADPKTGISPALMVPGVVTEAVTVDIGKQEERMHDGRDFVNDIIGVGKYKSAQQDLTKWGVFVTEGTEPTAEEIAEAHKKLKQSYSGMVGEADGFAAQGPNHLQDITAEHRRAAQVLNIERDWSKTPTEMMSCPGCGEKINPGVAVHGGRYGCGAILDRKKAEELGLAEPKKAGK